MWHGYAFNFCPYEYHYNETTKELDESINSILQQTYSNFEFLIINDNPNNYELEKTLKSYKDSRIKIIHNEENLGLVKSLNSGLNIVTANMWQEWTLMI